MLLKRFELSSPQAKRVDRFTFYQVSEYDFALNVVMVTSIHKAFY